jgi:transcriptional activator
MRATSRRPARVAHGTSHHCARRPPLRGPGRRSEVPARRAKWWRARARALDPGAPQVLLSRDGGYVLDVAPERVDAAGFERALEAGRRALATSPQRASSLLAEALAEWLGPALYQCGRQADALAVYRRLRSTLVSELGVEPGERGGPVRTATGAQMVCPIAQVTRRRRHALGPGSACPAEGRRHVRRWGARTSRSCGGSPSPTVR